MNFTIENASANDLDEIIEVLRPWNLHHIPSPEADEINFSCFFIAKVRNKIVGVSGYKLLDDNTGRTRSLAVYPEFQGSGIGKVLQDTRLEAMHRAGVKKVYTDIDRPEIILWYKKHYGYIETGQRKKRSQHGSLDTDYAAMLKFHLIVSRYN